MISQHIEQVQNSDISQRDKSLLYIIIYCGPKVKELQALKPQDISAAPGEVTINFPKRSITINDVGVRFAIVQWAGKVNKMQFGAPIFSSIKKNKKITGKPLSDVSMNKILQEVFPESNIRDFRRIFIDKVIEEASSKKEMRKQIGIGSDAALLHYTQ